MIDEPGRNLHGRVFDGPVVEDREVQMSDAKAAAEVAPISGLVPMVYVADIERSVAFYRLLGFEVGNSVPPGTGRKEWVWLYAPGAPDWKRGPNLMLTRRVTAAGEGGFLLYLYAADLPALHARMIAEGLNPGEISHPDYLPDGEFKVADPDRHTLMVAQSAADTP